MGDLSFEIAWHIASEMGAPPTPDWLGQAARCLEIVQGVQANVVPAWVTRGPMTYEVWRPIEDAAFTLWAASPESVHGIAHPGTRKNILLRLWAGCVGAGKMIDPQWPVPERATFFRDIQPLLEQCPIFSAGVSYAYDWKQSFNPPQRADFQGVPEGHLVRTRLEAAGRDP